VYPVGHVAAPPRRVMNSRRYIVRTLSRDPFCGIVVRVSMLPLPIHRVATDPMRSRQRRPNNGAMKSSHNKYNPRNDSVAPPPTNSSMPRGIGVGSNSLKAIINRPTTTIAIEMIKSRTFRTFWAALSRGIAVLLQFAARFA
jgi:hypothetical protein